MPLGAYVSQAAYDALERQYGAANLAALRIAPSTAYCPAADIDGATCLCAVPFVTESSECALHCQRAALIGAGSTGSWAVPFAASWIAMGEPKARAAAWAALPRGVRILSTNGWSDANVPPVTFGPEQQLLLANAGRPTYAAAPPTIFSIGAASVAAHTFANITHEMIDSAQSGSPP